MIRILGLVHQYIPVRCAGAESHIHAMFRALAHRGHRVDVVLSAQPGDPYEVDGVHVWPTVDRKHDATRWLQDADVLVSHLDNTARATMLGSFNNIPVALVHHNTFDPSKEALVMPMARADVVAVNSHHMADDLGDYFDTRDEPQPKTIIVRPTADPMEYATVPGGKVTLINLRRRQRGSGRDGLSKGGEVFRYLAETMPDVEFLGVTGAYGVQEDLADLPNVEVLEHVPHHEMRARVYARTKVLLVPSSYESWGRVASEAITSGIPVLASPTPGLVEQLQDAGTFVDPTDLQEWHDTLRGLLHDPDLWVRMSARSSVRSAELAKLGEADLRGWVEAVEAAVVANTYAA